MVDLIEKDPLISIEKLAEMFNLSEATISVDLQDLRNKAKRKRTIIVMQTRTNAFRRIKDEEEARKKEQRNEPNAYRMLDHLKKKENWGKTLEELAEDLGVKRWHIITFFKILVRAAEDPTNPKKAICIRKTLVYYCTQVTNKPDWWKRWRSVYSELFTRSEMNRKLVVRTAG